jgi:hypothetical protein
MSAEQSSLTEGNGLSDTGLDEVTVNSSVRTKFLTSIFPGLVNENKGGEKKVAIRLEKEKWGNGFGGDSWNHTLIKEEGIKYTFVLSEHPAMDLTVRDSQGEESFEKVYLYELEIDIPFKGAEAYKELEEFGLGVSLGRRISGQRSIFLKNLSNEQEFSLEDLSVLDNRESRELLSKVFRIPKLKGLERDYIQGDGVNTVSLKISF